MRHLPPKLAWRQPTSLRFLRVLWCGLSSVFLRVLSPRLRASASRTRPLRFRHRAGALFSAPIEAPSSAQTRVAPAHVSPLPPRSLVWTLFRDRKSTRLNSSHLGISYAVF